MKIDKTTYKVRKERIIGMTADHTSRHYKVLFFADPHFLFFKSRPTLHTLASRTSRRTDQNLPKSAIQPTHKRNSNYLNLNIKYMNKVIQTLYVFAVIILLASCGNSGKKTNEKAPTKDSIEVETIKPTVNVYIENSGSMDGYVKGVTEFEQTVYNYLTDIKISQFADSLNLFYINSDIIPQGSDISDFIEKLEPTTFRNRGGKRGTTDISNLLKSVLDETKPNEIAILVTDGIFSPGKGKDAEQYLVNQQIGIKSNMADYLQKYPNSSVIIYQLSSQFDGLYYNHEDNGTKINEQRPYYIWVIGENKLLNGLVQKVPESKFKGNGVQNVFSITGGPKAVDYAVKMGSGNFDLDKKEPKTTIENLKKESKGKQNTARFSVNANLSGFLLSDNYISDVSNYEMNNKDYSLTISKSVSNNFGYTHQLNFESGSVHKGLISVKLKTQIPAWVEDINDDDGATPVSGKTYGIKYQIHGIYEAFTITNNCYTEIKIKIN